MNQGRIEAAARAARGMVGRADGTLIGAAMPRLGGVVERATGPSRDAMGGAPGAARGAARR